MFRAFYRVFCLQAVMLHLLVAAAFTEGTWSGRPAWNAMTSAVITHAACAFFERFANMWMNRRQADPVDRQRAGWEWMEGKIKGKRATKAKLAEEGGATTASIPEESPLATARHLRRPITLEGAPLFGFLGVIEWLLV